MKLHIAYDPLAVAGVLSCSDTVPLYVWNRVKELIVGAQADAHVVGRQAAVPWSSVLNIVPSLAGLGRNHGLSLEYEARARELLRRYRAEYDAVRAAGGSMRVRLTETEIQQRLEARGFTRRRLTPNQMRDLAHLVSLANGANFSVPGAGKTTVTFALHLLIRDDDTFLLIVSPKNAFSAWDEVVVDCLDPHHPGADTTPFTRLVGGAANIQALFQTAPQRLIIGYEQLTRALDQVRGFMHTRKVHVILDESHRMKAGDRSQRGSALLALAHLPVRRDILSGTPIPRSIADIAPQVDFLWPGQGLGNKVAEAPSPRTTLQGLYVRTTKGEMGLPPVTRQTIAVTMSDPQLAFYSILRQEVVKQLAGIRADSNVHLLTAKKSIMRLLQVSSNPILAVRAMTKDGPERHIYDDPKIREIFHAIGAERDSPKIRQACKLARDLVERGQRCVIWTSFRENVERIAELLADLGATYIHGGVPAGADDDPDTREGRIRRFHEDASGCRVLVANPAACSEGISLHRVCHHAIYVDRTYNAAHFLQSVDRIHRLGLPPDTETFVTILESIAPVSTGSVDFSVRRRMITKLQQMADVLADQDLRQLILDEEEGEEPLDFSLDIDDLVDLIDELTGKAPEAGEEIL